MELPLDEYGLGLLLGDGSFRQGTPTFSKPEQQLHDALSRAFPSNRTTFGDARKGAVSLPAARGTNRLTFALKEMGLWGESSVEKFVPAPYLLAAPGQRLALLQGLLDTDGWVQHNDSGNSSAYFSTSSGCLAENVVELVESLGGTTRVTHKAGLGIRAAKDNPPGDSSATAAGHEPFRLKRKLLLWRAGRTTKITPPVRRITSVEYHGVGTGVGLRVVQPDVSLLIARFIVV